MGVKVDATTGANMTVEYGHHEIHQGSAFFIRDVVDQAISTVFDFQVTTPAGYKWVHLLFSVLSEDEVDFYLYEDVDIKLAGTAVTLHNSNRNSSKTSDAVVKTVVNASVGNANLDTDVTVGIELEHFKTGANRVHGTVDRAHEIILRADTDYCFRTVFTKAAYVVYDATWYEHTNKAQVDGLPWGG